MIPENDFLKDGKQLYDATLDTLSKIEGLVVDVNSVEHIQTRLLGTSPSPGQKTVAILLLNDKNDTPMMFKSLAYRHRGDGVVFGESRGAYVAQVSKEFGVKTYPHLLAIVGNSDSQKVERYRDKSMDSDSLSKWIGGLVKKA